MLFKKKEKSSIDEKRYVIPYSKNYRKFKHFIVSVHGNNLAEKNNSILLNKDLSNSQFEFVCFNYDNGRMAQLLIDGMIVGAVFENEQIQAIENGLIEQIHSEIKQEQGRLTFFVKYKE